MLRVVMIDGRPGDTVKYTGTDASQLLPAAILTDGGASCVGMLITVETNPVRIALGAAVATAALGHLLNPGDVYRISGNNLVSTFNYINANPGNNAVLQITPFYT